jgi:cytochrome c-type protein NapB
VLVAVAVTLAAPAAERTLASSAKSSAAVRAQRRAYDGAPPVIPHDPSGADCVSCHADRAIEVPGVGLSPPSPHQGTSGLGSTARCRQCHVHPVTRDTFRQSTFVGLAQDLRRGHRAHPLAPPVIPHPVFMRENCAACHTGPAAREEIRTSHPERTRCLQCHLSVRATGEFRRGP